MNTAELKPVVEAILMVAEQPLSIDRLGKLLDSDSDQAPTRDELKETLDALQADYSERGVELTEVASGFRFRARQEYATQIGRLWEERKLRYSRAFMETLAIIAYRQPITRGEIEHIRGVAVSTNIMRQLLEREWVRVVGHRDVPGRPAVYSTTRDLLDYFGMKSLSELPTLAELQDIDSINADMFAEPLPITALGDGANDETADLTSLDNGDETDGASGQEAESDEPSADDEAGSAARSEVESEVEPEVEPEVGGDDNVTASDSPPEPRSATEPPQA